jgi:hypothetical protein
MGCGAGVLNSTLSTAEACTVGVGIDGDGWSGGSIRRGPAGVVL